MMPLQTLRIIWLAIVATIPIYAGVGWYLCSQEPPEAMVSYVLAAMAMGPAVASFLVGPGKPIKIPAYQTASILRFALSESVALNGFVIHFMGGNVLIATALYIASLLLLLAHAPNERAFDEAART